MDQHVWIDHRVDVTLGSNQGADDCVTITRETLIDAHIEVRPLRVHFPSTRYNEARIYLPMYPITSSGNIIYDNTTTPSSWSQVDENMGGANENWIAIENNNGSSNKGRSYLPNGKRKYFTTSLIEELHAESANINIDNNANRYISLKDGDCAWIYFDENSTSTTRRAKIDVVFYYNEGDQKRSVTESYYIYQAGVIPIGENLKMESYEEYLYSYDSADKYTLGTSPTDYTKQGLEWGLSGQKISVDAIVSGAPLKKISVINRYFQDIISQRYDYYHQNDQPANNRYYPYIKQGSDWVDSPFGTGIDFTNRATEFRLGVKNGITIQDMGSFPENAYQYCLSKNKFKEDADGNHTLDLHWYLPDVYELQSIFAANPSSLGLSSDSYYWSSQPAYSEWALDQLPYVEDLINLAKDYIDIPLDDIDIKDEIVDQARAVTLSGTTPKYRKEKHKIRCLYSPTGITIDMSERVPNGLGGVIKVPMKAYVSYTSATNNVPGFFSAWLTNIKEQDASTTPSKTNHKFPQGESTNYLETFTLNNVLYYTQNPATSGAWKYVSQGTIYNTLNEYPGLSSKEIVWSSADRVEGTNDKSYTRTVGKLSGQEITSIPDNDKLAQKPLDHLEKTDILTISFSSGTNTVKAPTYSYRREDKTMATYSQCWIVPTYTSKTVTGSTGSKRDVTVDGITYSLYDVGDDYEYNGVMHTITAKKWSILSGKFTLGPKTYNQLGWTYSAGTGGWGNKNGELGKEDYSPPSTTIDTKYDKLEFFGGNSFTITAKPGYRIKSIKVYFSDNNKVNNVTGDLIGLSYRYLRLVDVNQTLPTTASPDYMSYSGDGASGWYQWSAPTVETYAKDVTLKLVAYAPTTSGLRPTSFQYEPASSADWYESDFNTSIVIDSFEIRIEEVEEPTTDE